MSKRSKSYSNSATLVDSNNSYSVTDALELVKKASYAKFDETVELAVRLGVDPRKAEQNLRGAVSLPNGTGKTVRVLVVAKGAKAEEAKAAGADYVGDQEIIEKIKGGWFEFDVVIATPDMMAHLGKIGRVLGPKGLMPNPKTGTVTMDVKNAVTEFKAGKIEYRVDKVGNIHVPIGKVSFDTAKLAENYKAIYDQLIRIKPSTVKGTYVKNVSISSTMGPGVKILIEN